MTAGASLLDRRDLQLVGQLLLLPDLEAEALGVHGDLLPRAVDVPPLLVPCLPYLAAH